MRKRAQNPHQRQSTHVGADGVIRVREPDKRIERTRLVEDITNIHHVPTQVHHRFPVRRRIVDYREDPRFHELEERFPELGRALEEHTQATGRDAVDLFARNSAEEIAERTMVNEIIGQEFRDIGLSPHVLRGESPYWGRELSPNALYDSWMKHFFTEKEAMKASIQVQGQYIKRLRGQIKGTMIRPWSLVRHTLRLLFRPRQTVYHQLLFDLRRANKSLMTSRNLTPVWEGMLDNFIGNMESWRHGWETQRAELQQQRGNISKEQYMEIERQLAAAFSGKLEKITRRVPSLSRMFSYAILGGPYMRKTARRAKGHGIDSLSQEFKQIKPIVRRRMHFINEMVKAAVAERAGAGVPG